jgi:hypothetical protein
MTTMQTFMALWPIKHEGYKHFSNKLLTKTVSQWHLFLCHLMLSTHEPFPSLHLTAVLPRPQIHFHCNLRCHSCFVSDSFNISSKLWFEPVLTSIVLTWSTYVRVLVWHCSRWQWTYLLICTAVTFNDIKFPFVFYFSCVWRNYNQMSNYMRYT